jgi:hypothetical protein
MNTLLNLHFDVRGDLLESARQCEEDVFLQAFGNTRSQLDEEYGPYEDQSVFVAVSDDAGHVVGTCRLITPGPAGLKTLNDVARQPWGIDGIRAARAAQIDISRTWDIATLGVRSDFRGGKLMVGLAMYHAIMKSTRINEVATATAIMDEHAHRVLSGAGYLFTTLPGARPAPYLGSESSIPVFGHWAGLADAQRRTNPDAYRLVTLGIGLDGIAVPEDSAFELRSRLASVPELVDSGPRAGVAA